jgi:lipoate-protein ligase A
LSGGESNADGTLCFQHPVGYDLMEFDGVKIAGAGQRRTKSGLLHQGSVADACDFAASRQRAERLAGALAVSTFERSFDIPSETLRILGERYSRASWTGCR